MVALRRKNIAPKELPAMKSDRPVQNRAELLCTDDI